MIYEITGFGKDYFAFQNEWLLDVFNKYSVSVFGATGTGKDLMFAHHIALADAPHYANLVYNKKTIIAPLALFEIKGMKHEDVLKRRIMPASNRIIDGLAYYISDGAIYIPNTDDARLKKENPGLHIYAALRRQLNNLQIHINAQTFERLYIIYREQSECFIWTRGTLDLGDKLLVQTFTYDNERSAAARLFPSESSYRDGNVAERWFLIDKAELHYDTRFFRSIFYNHDTVPSVNLLKEFFHYEA